MISEGIIKQQFVINKLKEGADSVFRFQLNSFSARLKSQSGNTLSRLTSPDYTMSSSGENFLLSAGITKQLRFQDLGIRKLYTKPLFGALKHTYGQIKYGLGEEIKEQISQELQNAVKP